MKRVHLFASIVLLSIASLAQQPSGTINPQDRATNPSDQSTRPTDQTYRGPVETGHNWGGWGLLGLLGLGGLLGRRQQTTGTTYTRDERTYPEQQRRAG